MAAARMRLLGFAFGLAALATSQGASGRFLETDADRVDDEERYGSETYNDEISYRYPVDWDELWDRHDVGFRVSAGSLDVRRFDYREDWRAAAAPDGPVGLRVEASRREDTLEERVERSIGLDARVAGPWRVALLGDGGSRKEFGDVGGAVAFRRDRDHEVRAAYWSVDHYYETKRPEPEDRRGRRPDATALAARWDWGDLRLRLSAEDEHPLTWHRPSRGYDYEYQRRTLGYRVDARGGAGTSPYVAGAHERKREAKAWTGEGAAGFRKDMTRSVDQLELGAVRREGAAVAAAGVILIRRECFYGFDAALGTAPADAPEPPSEPRVARSEGAAFATWHAPAGGAGHFLQFGAFVNDVRLEEETVEHATEVKAQAAWDYHLTETARVLLNSTWDLDQLGGDFPYTERPFRPWGGGNLQIVAVF